MIYSGALLLLALGTATPQAFVDVANSDDDDAHVDGARTPLHPAEPSPRGTDAPTSPIELPLATPDAARASSFSDTRSDACGIGPGELYAPLVERPPIAIVLLS